jgi:hypothetical protein
VHTLWKIAGYLGLVDHSYSGHNHHDLVRRVSLFKTGALRHSSVGLLGRGDLQCARSRDGKNMLKPNECQEMPDVPEDETMLAMPTKSSPCTWWKCRCDTSEWECDATSNNPIQIVFCIPYSVTVMETSLYVPTFCAFSTHMHILRERLHVAEPGHQCRHHTLRPLPQQQVFPG